MKFIKSRANKIDNREYVDNQIYVRPIEDDTMRQNILDVNNLIDLLNNTLLLLDFVLENKLDTPILPSLNNLDAYDLLYRLRKLVGDPDTDPNIKTKDIAVLTMLMLQNTPPKELILAGFSMTPVRTSLGNAFVSNDGTLAFINIGDQVVLAVGDFRPKRAECSLSRTLDNFDMNSNVLLSEDELLAEYFEYTDENIALDETSKQYQLETDILRARYILSRTVECPKGDELTTGDVINGFKYYNGTLDEYLKELPQTKLVQQAIALLKQYDISNLQEVTKKVCSQNVDWRTRLFWKLIIDFTFDLDLVRMLAGFTIKPIEEIINFAFDKLRLIRFGWPFNWRPFGWLPVVTWWEDLLYWFLIRSYEMLCDDTKFSKNMILATNIGGQALVNQVMSGNLKFNSKLGLKERQMLCVLLMGYNVYGKSHFTVENIQDTLGNVFVD